MSGSGTGPKRGAEAIANQLTDDTTADLRREAEGLLDRALTRAYALRRSGEADEAGHLLRSVHSCKSLMAFAGDQEEAALAGAVEDNVQALWCGQVPLTSAGHDLVHRALLRLKAGCGCHSAASGDMTALRAELANALEVKAGGPPAEAASRDPHPGPTGRESTSLSTRLSLADLTALHSQSQGLVRMARLLHEQALRQGSHTADLTETLQQSADRLEASLRRHVQQGLRPFMLPLVGAMQAMAAGQGKRVAVRIEAPDTNLPRPFLKALRPSLLHLVRNAVTHGIESPEVRSAGGKPPQGRITVSAEVRESFLYLRVRDDGQGFNLDALRRAAEAAGPIGDAEGSDRDVDDLLSLALLPGLSTTAVADDYSGRGLGLTVVAEDVASLGGTVKLESQPGECSQITLTVPLPRQSASQ